MYISDFTYNGHLYLVVNDYLTQNDSQANCVSLGANLASVWSHEENSRLLEVTTEDYCRPAACTPHYTRTYLIKL